MHNYVEPGNPQASQHWIDQYLPEGRYGQKPESGLVNTTFLRGAIFRQRYLIMATIGLVLLASLIITLLTTPIYRAAATVRIDPYGNNIAIDFGLPVAKRGHALRRRLRACPAGAHGIGSAGGPAMMRWIWALMILVIAALVAAAQIDRQSRYAPELSHLVPVSMGGFALYHRTARSLEQGDLDRGLREAKQLVAARPMPAENLRLYAQAQLLTGNEELAAQAFQMAAHRGWRDPMAQEVQLRLALAAGDGVEAGRRLAALWARSADKAKLAELSQQVLENPEGRTSFAQILAETPRWSSRFTTLGPAILPQELSEEIRREARLD